MISKDTIVKEHAEESSHCTEFMHSILLYDCAVPREEDFVLLLNYCRNHKSAGLSVEGIYLFIE